MSTNRENTPWREKELCLHCTEYKGNGWGKDKCNNPKGVIMSCPPYKGCSSFTQKQEINAMRKPIYFNEERMDLLWLPQYGKVVGEVANELYSEGMHFDNEIRKQGKYLRSVFINNTIYKAWSCNKPSALCLLSHPKIQEINAMTQIRTIPTKEQVLEAAKKCPQTKEALKILFPEDFEADIFAVKKFDIVERIGENPYKGQKYIVLPRDDDLDLYCLTIPGEWWGVDASKGLHRDEFKLSKVN